MRADIDTRMIRAFFESPILDERKWAKAGRLPADALLVDLEDTVAPARKDEARERLVTVMKGASAGDRAVLVPRINLLSSTHFDADVAAVAETQAELVAYPKLADHDELRALVAAFERHGRVPGLLASIESAAGVQAVDEIAADPRVRGLLFGAADLGLDMGIPMVEAKDLRSPALRYARSRVVTAAAANRIAAITMAFPTDMKDLQETRDLVEEARRLGFTGMMSFYPPQVDLINGVFTPSPSQVDAAQETVQVYARAREEGLAAAYRSNGDLVLAFDHEAAQDVLRRWEVFRTR